MAWIELHDTLPDHPKVIDLSLALGIDKDAVVGKLVRLWTWALNNRETGVFTERDASTIAEIMRFKGKPEQLIEAMKEVHLLDEQDGNLVIHDWDEHVCMLLAKREKVRELSRIRKQRQRAKESECHANVTRDEGQCHAVTVPKPYLNRTNTPTGCIYGADAPTADEPKRAVFLPPSVEDVRAYCEQRGNGIDAQCFVDFYSSKGWMIGKNKMKDWKAAVRTWEQSDRRTPAKGKTPDRFANLKNLYNEAEE